jgi:hypothetical protein
VQDAQAVACDEAVFFAARRQAYASGGDAAVGAVAAAVIVGGWPQCQFVSASVPSLSEYDARLRRILCLNVPSGVTTVQQVRVVVSYVEARPERMHESFRLLAFEALQAAWPYR